MSLYEHYKSTPESIESQRTVALHDSHCLVGVRTQVVTDHLKAASGMSGIFSAIPEAQHDPAFINADRAARLKLIASASLLQWATGVTTYDTGIDGLNRQYDDAKATGFGVDADQYYDHGTQTQEQRDAAYHHALANATSGLLIRLAAEKAKLDSALDDDATSAKATLNTDPSDANLTTLFQAGLFPVEASLSFSGIDTSKVDIAALVANLKALGLLPDGVDGAALQQMQSLISGLGGSSIENAGDLLRLAELMKGMDPAALRLFMALVPADDLNKWNTAIESSGGFVGNGYKLALSNQMLQALSSDQVRTFMQSMTALQPGFNGSLKDAQWTWLAQELGADSAALDQVNQGEIGDCWFIASIGAEQQLDPSFVSDHIHDNGNGTYTVTFYDDGNAVQVTVDGEIPTNDGGDGSPGAHTDSSWGSDSATWLAIYEKAYASYKGGSYDDIEGGFGDQGMSDLTGVDTGRDDNGILGGPSLKDIQQQLADGHPVTVGTRDDAGFWWWQNDDDDRVDDHKLVSNHEYIVKEVQQTADGAWQIVLLNPWGASGSAPYEVTLSEAEYRSFIDAVSHG